MIFFGAAMIIVGAVLLFFDKIPFLGKLPGDITIKGRNYSIYFPIVTCLLISIILTILLNLFSRK